MYYNIINKRKGCFKMSNITITNHPLIQHKLSILRDKNTASKEFRALIGEIAMLMCYEATRDLELKEVDVENRRIVFHAKRLSEVAVFDED